MTLPEDLRQLLLAFNAHGVEYLVVGGWRWVLCDNRFEENAALTIEIQKPELEALILERMQSGAFESVEDVLLQALEGSPASRQPRSQPECEGTGADLVAAMQASPYKEIGLEPERGRTPVREVRL